MMPALIGLVAFVALAVIIGMVFAAALPGLVINAVIIYLVGLRAFKELDHGGIREYGIGAVVSIVVLMVVGNVIPFLWAFTTWLLLTFAAAHLYRMVMKK